MDRRHFIGASLAGAGALSVTGPATRTVSAASRKLVEETPVILECAITGSTTKAKNRLVPETPADQAIEMIKCLDAGATIVHSHSNLPDKNPAVAAKPYMEAYRPVREKHPYAILYATANFDPQVYNKTGTTWPGRIQYGPQRLLAEAGLANMVLFDTSVVPLAGYDADGIPGPASTFFWYGFRPDDVRYVKKICDEMGTGASISVFEPGWMKNVLAMVKAGSLPRGSKLNIYFGSDDFALMAPPIPEALELYLKMMEGLDLKWSVGYMGEKSVMYTLLARLALEKGGSFRVGLEDFAAGPPNLDQLHRANELVNSVGRRVVTGAEAIEYLDIPCAATRPDQ